ncbi:GNAT family N-acetyltransferase [Mesobacillus harenae]|uniref:GNAT family N-acetyltransferase n=1 Tax=Mesobacillus harenae TaxID=2213203 RepID=UPI001580CE55|nr:GNAT family N-acetyltransferase [Mesobacillus harenae]
MERKIAVAGEIERDEIFDYAGINREEATGTASPDSRINMIEAYEHSLKHDAYFLCVKEGDSLLGWIMVDKSFDWLNGEEIGWINDVYVKKDYRGQGLSSWLMEAALEDLRQLGHTEVRLNVYSFNEKAIALYKKFGFENICTFMGRSL